MGTKTTIILLIPFLFIVGCTTPQQTSKNRNATATGSTKKVRTTAYTHTEAGGRKTRSATGSLPGM